MCSSKLASRGPSAAAWSVVAPGRHLELDLNGGAGRGVEYVDEAGSARSGLPLDPVKEAGEEVTVRVRSRVAVRAPPRFDLDSAKDLG